MIHDISTDKLIITDFVENVRQINTLVDQLDIEVNEERETIRKTFELKYLTVEQALEIIQKSLPDLLVEDSRHPSTRRVSVRRKASKPSRPKIQFIDLKVGNKIMVVGEKSKVDEIEKLLEDLDGEFKTDKKATYEVIKIDKIRISELISILEKILYGNNRNNKVNKVTLGGKVEFIPIQNTPFLMIVGDETDREMVKNIINDITRNLDSIREKEKIEKIKEIRIIPIQYAKSQDIIDTLKKLQSGNGGSSTDLISQEVKLINNSQKNSIVITAERKKIEEIELLIRELDKRRTQVLIEVKMYEVSYNDDTTLGFDFNALSLSGISSIAGLFSALFNPAINFLEVAKTVFSPDVLDSLFIYPNGIGTSLNADQQSAALFNALQRVADVNTLSTPNLLTLDNEKAIISIVDQESYLERSTTLNEGVTLNTDQYRLVDAGLTLEVIPQVNDDETVTLDIKQQIDDFRQLSLSSVEPPRLTKRRLENKSDSQARNHRDYGRADKRKAVLY